MELRGLYIDIQHHPESSALSRSDCRKVVCKTSRCVKSLTSFPKHLVLGHEGYKDTHVISLKGFMASLCKIRIAGIEQMEITWKHIEKNCEWINQKKKIEKSHIVNLVSISVSGSQT